MKLVLIQGDILARYAGRQQCEVARVDWEQIEDRAALIEDIRVYGIT